MIRVIISFLLFAFLSTSIFGAEENAKASKEKSSNPQLSIATIEKFTHLKGYFNPQTDIYRISVPRDDLSIIVNGVKLTPAMGLTSWAAFKRTANGTTMRADLVVTENQVNTVMSTALANKLSITGLHNHLLWESPMVMFLHVEGTGDEKSLAIAINRVFTKIKDTNDDGGDFPLAEIDASDTTLNPETINKILGSKGAMKNGVYKVELAKAAKSEDPAIAKSYGITAVATFAGSDEETVIDGNLAMQTSELQRVLKPLHNAGIVIVALHQQVNHDPKAIFVHYFGVGKAQALAKGLRSAIDSVNLTPPTTLPATAVARNMTLTMPGCLIPSSSLPITPIATPVNLVVPPTEAAATKKNATVTQANVAAVAKLKQG